jgi:hypothetical protein
LEENSTAVAVGAVFAELTACDGIGRQAENLIIPEPLFMKFGLCCIRVTFIIEDC